jgi:hypothetical protein
MKLPGSDEFTDIIIITAEHRDTFAGCPIEIYKEDGVCYIYSNEEIPGLTLVAENIKRRG